MLDYLDRNGDDNIEGSFPWERRLAFLPFFLLVNIFCSDLALAEEAETLDERPYDLIILKNGTSFKGTIEAEDETGITMVMENSPLKLTFKKGENPEDLKEITRRYSKQDTYKKEEKAAGEDPKQHYALAKKCRNSGMPDEYAAELNRVIELDPKALKAFRNLLDHYVSVGDQEGQFRVCLEARKQEFKEPDMTMQMGEIYLQIGLHHWALREFREVQQLAPKMLLARVREADVQRMLGAEKESLDIYAEILGIEPDNPDALFGRAQLAMQKGQLSVAKEVLTEAVSARKEFHDASYRLGLVLLGLGQPGAALDHLPKIPPEFVHTYFASLNTAVAESANGNTGKAQEILDGLLEAEPADYLKLAQGFVYEHLKEEDAPTRAITVYEELTKGSPENYFAHLGLGRALIGAVKMDLAVETFKKAIRIRPRYWPAYLAQGLVLLAQNEVDRAIPQFVRAKDLHNKLGPGKDPDLLFAIGHVWILGNNLDEAARFFRGALEVHPKHKAARAGMTEIKRRKIEAKLAAETPVEKLAREAAEKHKAAMPDAPPLPMLEKETKEAMPDAPSPEDGEKKEEVESLNSEEKKDEAGEKEESVKKEMKKTSKPKRRKTKKAKGIFDENMTEDEGGEEEKKREEGETETVKENEGGGNGETEETSGIEGTEEEPEEDEDEESEKKSPADEYRELAESSIQRLQKKVKNICWIQEGPVEIKPKKESKEESETGE